MCGRPDFAAEYEHVENVVLNAFWTYKSHMREMYDIEDEESEKTDWVKTFCDDVSDLLRELEKKGKLVKKQDD